MNIIYDNDFSGINDGCEEQPYLIFPTLYKDDRGWFQEVLKDEFATKWIQINRSCSKPGVVRGCHAQSGKYCQGKLVEPINSVLFDFICDCRPMSKTFKKCKFYVLDPDKQNKLYVPKGFLHGFVVPYSTQQMTYFNYYCNEVYSKSNEICINPINIMLATISEMKTAALSNILIYDDYWKLFNDFGGIYSEKDLNGIDFNKFTTDILNDYNKNGIIWYK